MRSIKNRANSAKIGSALYSSVPRSSKTSPPRTSAAAPMLAYRRSLRGDARSDHAGVMATVASHSGRLSQQFAGGLGWNGRAIVSYEAIIVTARNSDSHCSL
jgi:hypothetical protein